jgi:hypothetical protein
MLLFDVAPPLKGMPMSAPSKTVQASVDIRYNHDCLLAFQAAFLGVHFEPHSHHLLSSKPES